MQADDRSSRNTEFQTWQCLNDNCRLRYPTSTDSRDGPVCLRCRHRATRVGSPFVGRGWSPTIVEGAGPASEVLLDNIRSSHNVGSIFRSCDGAGVGHIHLCGITSTPRQGKVGKAALGAEETVPWSYHANAVDAVESIRMRGLHVWSLENRESSQSIFQLRPEELRAPILLVVGNELSGVDPEIVRQSDRVVSIPMRGHKASLNAAVAFGITVYWLQHGVLRDAATS